MAAATMKYPLQAFRNISMDGFNFTVPEDTMNLISSLSMEVGSPTYIRTPVFQKKEAVPCAATAAALAMPFSTPKKKKAIATKRPEVEAEDWSSLRSFQTTKIEKKSGLDGEIDKLRLLLNKLSDKTYMDISDKISQIMEELVSNGAEEEQMQKVGKAIFDIASSNKFYSMIYAELYSMLLTKFAFLKPVFETSFNSFLSIFHQIEYFDADKDYDKFCEMNKVNDKRKALSTFFVNLALNGMLAKESLASVTSDLVRLVLQYIKEPNRKNEVDEITENIALLYHKDLVASIDACAKVDGGKTVTEVITILAKSKTKDYLSLSNKSIFKFMDLVNL